MGTVCTAWIEWLEQFGGGAFGRVHWKGVQCFGVCIVYCTLCAQLLLMLFQRKSQIVDPLWHTRCFGSQIHKWIYELCRSYFEWYSTRTRTNKNNKERPTTNWKILHSHSTGNIDVPFIAHWRFKVFPFAIKLIQLDCCSSSFSCVLYRIGKGERAHLLYTRNACKFSPWW